MHYVYILKCKDGSLYTGYAKDLHNRLKAHKEGKGAKYTKCRLPVKLMYYEKIGDKSKAMSREYAIKQMSRNEKELLIKERARQLEDFEDK
jgi:putative endonuclease